MEAIWQLALENLPLLVVPACGFVLALVVLRVKERYLKEGILFRRSRRQREDSATKSAEQDEPQLDKAFDIALALRTFEELGLEEGGSGYAYWREVGHLLKRAADMQAEIELLNNELERCRAVRPKKK
ncbi:hypothetical protein PQR57_13885 [Paraburkholderia dipogonis]|uniref:Uncharacterized protein n=1 Tax=Paraburkholderia dipogonis TaxID=1211383 RepID=A0ABW9AQD1_9BURK